MGCGKERDGAYGMVIVCCMILVALFWAVQPAAAEVMLAAGARSSFALDAQGRLYGWGDDGDGNWVWGG